MNTLSPRSREEYKTGRDKSQSHSHSEVSWRKDHHFWTEVKVRDNVWLFCLFGLQIVSEFLLIVL